MPVLSRRPKEKIVPSNSETLSELLRQVRDRLKVTGMGLGLVNLQLDAGATRDAKATLADVRDALQMLRFGMEEAFEPTIPLHAKPTHAKSLRAKSVAPQVTPAGNARKALLVEDDPNERELLAGFLRLSGLEVATAGDGCAALDYLHGNPCPDVMLLDMGLPRCDGPTAVREIRREPAYHGLKIFAVTGHPPEDLDVETGPMGINRWFRKPLDPGALLQELTRELDQELCGV